MQCTIHFVMHSLKALLVALLTGEVRLYNENVLVATLHLGEPLTALRFGSYGREESALVTVGTSGASPSNATPPVPCHPAIPYPPSCSPASCHPVSSILLPCILRPASCILHPAILHPATLPSTLRPTSRRRADH